MYNNNNRIHSRIIHKVSVANQSLFKKKHKLKLCYIQNSKHIKNIYLIIKLFHQTFNTLNTLDNTF